MLADVVIGAAYGDEGKGRTVSALSSPNSVTVRFNGGAQAAHTVVQIGHRHVFHHLGAGALSGAKTYLSRYFACHPPIFRKEIGKLQTLAGGDWFELGQAKNVYVHPQSPITTIFDGFINAMAEKQRDGERHGSCGIGYGETIERQERGHSIIAGDLFDLSEAEFKEKLRWVQKEWAPKRCEELGLRTTSNLAQMWKGLESATALAQFQIDCMWFKQHIKLCTDWTELGKHFVFEGAQGLMLDPEYGTMPYCTRSSCGLKNVRAMFDEYRPDMERPVNVHYVSRSYTTRHGAVPLAKELAHPPTKYNIQDQTNVPNEWQDSMRYSYLNLDTLNNTIQADWRNYSKSEWLRRGVMTCYDQLPGRDLFGEAKYIWEDKEHSTSADDLFQKFKERAVQGYAIIISGAETKDWADLPIDVRYPEPSKYGELTAGVFSGGDASNS